VQDIEKFYELNQQLTMDDLARKKFTHTQAREKIKQLLANHSPAENPESIVLVMFYFLFLRDGGFSHSALPVGQNHVVFRKTLGFSSL
jgi:hypothetical protein